MDDIFIWTIYFFFCFSFLFFCFSFFYNKRKQGREWNPAALLVFRWQGDTPKRDVVPEFAENLDLLVREGLGEKVQPLLLRDRGTPTLLTGQKRGQPKGHQTTLLFGIEGVEDTL